MELIRLAYLLSTHRGMHTAAKLRMGELLCSVFIVCPLHIPDDAGVGGLQPRHQGVHLVPVWRWCRGTAATSPGCPPRPCLRDSGVGGLQPRHQGVHLVPVWGTLVSGDCSHVTRVSTSSLFEGLWCRGTATSPGPPRPCLRDAGVGGLHRRSAGLARTSRRSSCIVLAFGRLLLVLSAQMSRYSPNLWVVVVDDNWSKSHCASIKWS